MEAYKDLSEQSMDIFSEIQKAKDSIIVKRMESLGWGHMIDRAKKGATFPKMLFKSYPGTKEEIWIDDDSQDGFLLVTFEVDVSLDGFKLKHF